MTLSAAARRTVVLALACLVAPGAAAADCPRHTHCSVVTVPLDRSGGVPGKVHLTVYERDAKRAATNAPLIALSGGPGEAATPFFDESAFLLDPALRSRDLVVFDQRGTGLSDPLDCPSLGINYDAREPSTDIEKCAHHLGPRRAFYTSRDNADDIEAIRQSLGVPKVTLYGVSFGTYTAMTYARRYPEHVESLVLDSTLGPDGVDPYDRNSYAALPRVLADECGKDCPVADIVATFDHLVAHLRRKRIRTHLVDFRGRRHHFSVSQLTVRDLLLAGDFDPLLRESLPAAIAAADGGDGAPIARLYQSTSSSTFGDAVVPVFDTALYYATHCGDLRAPWSRAAPLATRTAALRAAIGALPATAFAPFSPTLEAIWGESTECLRWPEAGSESPAVTGPLPDVPALILAGVDDTRTPLENATQVASLLPHSQLLAVPNQGHSVLDSDMSDCSSNAIHAFFAGRQVAPCG